MPKDKISKTDLHIEYLTESYCEYVSELFNIDKRAISDEEIDEFQSQITDLVKEHGKKIRLVVKVKMRKGYMVKNLGENYYRKARFVEDVVKNGIEIPSDATYFDLTLSPAILATNVQKDKTEVKVMKQDLIKTTIYMGDVTADKERVSTGKGEYHKLTDEKYNEFVWNDFDTRLISVKGKEREL